MMKGCFLCASLGAGFHRSAASRMTDQNGCFRIGAVGREDWLGDVLDSRLFLLLLVDS